MISDAQRKEKYDCRGTDLCIPCMEELQEEVGWHRKICMFEYKKYYPWDDMFHLTCFNWPNCDEVGCGEH